MRATLVAAWSLVAFPGTLPAQDEAVRGRAVVDSLFAAIREARWTDGVRFLDLAALADEIQQALRPPPPPVTAADLMRADPTLPRAVAEYQASQAARWRGDGGEMLQLWAGTSSCAASVWRRRRLGGFRPRLIPPREFAGCSGGQGARRRRAI